MTDFDYTPGADIPAKLCNRGEYYFLYWRRMDVDAPPTKKLLKCIRATDTIKVFREVNPGNNKAVNGLTYTINKWEILPEDPSEIRLAVVVPKQQNPIW